MTPLERAIRKSTVRIIPILTLGMLINYIDRTSVSFASLTMNEDVGISAAAFGFAAGAASLGYSLFEFPSNLALYRLGARRWLARIMITWGLAVAATCFVTGPTSYSILRFLLGAFEAGYFPGAAFLLTRWFPAGHRTRALAWLSLGVPLGNMLGGPIASLVTHLNGALGLAGWQWIFISEGAPACILGIILLLFIVNDPSEAKWLAPDEREALTTALRTESRHQPKRHIRAALADVRVVLLVLVQFGFVLGGYGIAIWLPQILKGYSLSTSTIGWLAAVPYMFSSVAMLTWARQADRRGGSAVNLVIACSVSAAGLIMSTLFHSLTMALVSLTIALIGSDSARGIFWVIPTRFLADRAAAGGLAFINSLGALGGFVGPYLVGVIKQSSGSFAPAALALSGFLVLSAILSAVLLVILRRVADGQRAVDINPVTATGEAA